MILPTTKSLTWNHPRLKESTASSTVYVFSPSVSVTVRTSSSWSVLLLLWLLLAMGIPPARCRGEDTKYCMVIGRGCAPSYGSLWVRRAFLLRHRCSAVKKSFVLLLKTRAVGELKRAVDLVSFFHAGCWSWY